MRTRTYVAKPGEIPAKWHLIDADGVVLGRLAGKVVQLLRGKHRPQFTPHVECGDIIVVVNMAKIKVTGNKMDDKVYFRYSGYPGGAKFTSLKVMMAKHPDRALRLAVWGMLPESRMRSKLIRKVKIYAGPNHPHSAQNPQVLKV